MTQHDLRKLTKQASVVENHHYGETPGRLVSRSYAASAPPPGALRSQPAPYELDNKAMDQSYASDVVMLRGVHDRLKSCAGDSCWMP